MKEKLGLQTENYRSCLLSMTTDGEILRNEVSIMMDELLLLVSCSMDDVKYITMIMWFSFKIRGFNFL